MDTIGFIGMGNMGFAMLEGCRKALKETKIMYTDVNRERLEFVKEQTGILYSDTAEDIVKACKYVILAVKPQYMDRVLHSIRGKILKNQLILSIAAGISIHKLKNDLGMDIRVVRAMPNTPALVKEGMSGICFSEDVFTKEEEDMISRCFQSFGKCERVEEDLIDAVMCASGCVPAYVYMMIEALADSAVKYGMPRDKAYTFAAQAVRGAATMVLETGIHPGVLKDQVCSPAGTTIAGVSALEKYGFRNAVIQAGDAVIKRNNEMQR